MDEKRSSSQRAGLNRSGIEVLLELQTPTQAPTQDISDADARRFARDVVATSYTWERYRGVRQLRVWQALALHHCLDPDVLGLNRRERLGFLKRAAAKLPPESPLSQYVRDLPALLSHVHSGSLVTVKNTEDCFQSFVAVKTFREYLDLHGMRASPQQPSSLQDPEFPPRLQLAIDAYQDVWIKQGFRAQNEDVKVYVRNRGVRSAFLLQAIARVCRPANVPRGRKAKDNSQ